MNKALDFLQEYKGKVNPQIEEFLQGKLVEMGGYGTEIKKAMETFIELAKEGKRFRGGLMYLGYKVAGGENEEEIIKASKFVEIFHVGLVVQDDVMDQDKMRRGKPTVHSVYADEHFGESMGVLVGDLCLSWAMEILLNSQFGQARVMAVMSEYQRYFERVVVGQMMDVSAGVRGEVSGDEEILQILQMKTAEYTGVLPLVAGVRLAGISDESELNKYREYGVNLGWAFQIMDDMLSIFGSDIGKRVGNDLTEKKQTMLVRYLREHGSVEQVKVLDKVWGKKEIEEEELEAVRKAMRESGAYDYVKGEGEKYVEKAKRVVGELGVDGDLQEVMNEMVEYMRERIK